MTIIPEQVNQPVLDRLDDELELIHRGKVRDIYRLPNGRLLIVTTDRISIFDFVLPCTIPGKGEVLNALNIYWRQALASEIMPTDLVAYGNGIDKYLPSDLRAQPTLQRRAVVVDELDMLPIELIVRGYLTGSGLKSYKRDGTVSGHHLPDGLRDGSKLPKPLFTPTTKATEGHDEQMDYQQVRDRFGDEPERVALDLYKRGAAIAAEYGVIIADTKFECGIGRGGALTLGDEVLTPDSSRFWDEEEWKHAFAHGTTPPSQDKQYIRDHGKMQGLPDLDPTSKRDQQHVQALDVPDSVIENTKTIYERIALRILGKSVRAYQNEQMKVFLPM